MIADSRQAAHNGTYGRFSGAATMRDTQGARAWGVHKHDDTERISTKLSECQTEVVEIR
jgi:hypothetical protein